MSLTVVRKRVPDLQKAIETGRNNYIGGSDAATVLGANRYKSAYTLWAEMAGFVERSEPAPDNERIRLGHDLEQYVAERWMEYTGKKCRRDNTEYSLQEFPFMVGHIDRRVVGEEAGLEIKTTSEFNRTDFKGNDIEPYYYHQCLHYLAVTGLKRWYLAILQYGRGCYFFQIDRNEEEIENLIKAEASFFQMVQTKTPPLVDGSDSTSDTLAAMWAGSETDDLADLYDLTAEFNRRQEIDEAKKALDAEKKEIDNRIKATMESATRGTCGAYRATYKTQERQTIDTEKLKAERPEIFAQYIMTTESRVLRITRAKERKTK